MKKKQRDQQLIITDNVLPYWLWRAMECPDVPYREPLWLKIADFCRERMKSKR